jgi:acyl-CoA synthetase (AMP-forming)/AMP-acid ligase II
LQREGLAPGARVGILCKNSVDNLLLFLGCAAAGLVPVAINYRLSAVEVAMSVATPRYLAFSTTLNF